MARLASSADNSIATRFGRSRNARAPFLARVLPGPTSPRSLREPLAGRFGVSNAPDRVASAVRGREAALARAVRCATTTGMSAAPLRRPLRRGCASLHRGRGRICDDGRTPAPAYPRRRAHRRGRRRGSARGSRRAVTSSRRGPQLRRRSATVRMSIFCLVKLSMLAQHPVLPPARRAVKSPCLSRPAPGPVRPMRCT